jgi:hypothetical protein
MFGNVLASTDPTGSASAWGSIATGSTVQITGVTCPAANEPHAPFFPNALFSTSCPAAEFCALGATGEVLTSANPLAPAAPVPVKGPVDGAKKKPKKHKPRPKRPRVILAEGSWPEMVVPHGRALLQFRFHVKRGIQIRGYVCSFDHQKMRRCKSPQRYRVGPGHHAFRVRAVGWTGLRGPMEVSAFQVCRHPAARGICREP